MRLWLVANPPECVSIFGISAFYMLCEKQHCQERSFPIDAWQEISYSDCLQKEYNLLSVAAHLWSLLKRGIGKRIITYLPQLINFLVNIPSTALLVAAHWNTFLWFTCHQNGADWDGNKLKRLVFTYPPIVPRRRYAYVLLLFLKHLS